MARSEPALVAVLESVKKRDLGSIARIDAWLAQNEITPDADEKETLGLVQLDFRVALVDLVHQMRSDTRVWAL